MEWRNTSVVPLWTQYVLTIYNNLASKYSSLHFFEYIFLYVPSNPSIPRATSYILATATNRILHTDTPSFNEGSNYQVIV